MNEIATFFREHGRDGGRTAQLENGDLRFAVYSRKPLDVRGDVTRERVLKSVENAGGGLVVEARQEDGSRQLSVTRVGRNDPRPAKDFVLLSPGRQPHCVAIDGKELSVVPSSHAIVPVDGEANTRLKNWLEHLLWFSPDLESLLLTAIRRPSLDVRLDRVETRLFGEPVDKALAREDGRLLMRLRKKAAVVCGVATAILLWLILSLNSLMLYRLYEKEFPKPAPPTAANPVHPPQPPVPQPTQPSTQTAAATTATPPPAAPAPEPEKPIVTAAKPLMEALREKKDLPAFKVFYKAHFNRLNRNLNNEQIEDLFTDESFLWGLMKLEALRLGGTSQDQAFFGNADSAEPTQKVFESLGPAIDGSRPFLGAISCRLKRTPNYPSEFVKDGRCRDLGLSKIQAGLPNLMTYVKGLQ